MKSILLGVAAGVVAGALGLLLVVEELLDNVGERIDLRLAPLQSTPGIARQEAGTR